MKHSIQTNNAGLFITFKDNKIKNKIHHEKETRGQPYTFPKKGIKNTLNYYLSLFTYSRIQKRL